MLGRYLDALPPEARQRIEMARLWTTRRYAIGGGARCILGHAEDWSWDATTQSTHCHAPELLPLREVAGDSWLNWPPLIGMRFDRLVERLGMSRAVALLQRRARSKRERYDEDIDVARFLEQTAYHGAVR